MFLDENGKAIPFSERVTKGTAVGVPGTLKGLEEALDKWGTRSMKKLIAPSIKLAEKGFPIDSVLADAISNYQEKAVTDCCKRCIFAKWRAAQRRRYIDSKGFGKNV